MHPSKELEIIQKKAVKVRKWAEEYAQKHGFPWDLSGLCAIASAKLYTELKKYKSLELTLCGSVNDNDCIGHTFLMCNGYIVDVTATQFGINDEVVIQTDTNNNWFWVPSYQFNNPKELRKEQIKSNWPAEQVIPLYKK